MSTVTGAQDPIEPNAPSGSPAPPGRSGPAPQGATNSSGWYWLVTVAAGVVLLAVGWPVYAAAYGVWVIGAMLIAIAQAAAPVLAVRLPAAAIVVSAASAIGGIVTTAHTVGLVWPWAVTATISLALTHAVIGLRASWPRLVILWTLTTAIGAGALVLPHSGGVDGSLAGVITTASITAAVAGIAVLGRLWLRGRSELAAQRRLGAEETAKRTELEERNRIAQELHDVVAHSMSVISVQATTAPYRLPELDDRSRAEFDSIAGSARQALTEMRGLLAILRGGRDAELAPQPTIDDIPGLVAATRGTGAEVDLTVEVDPARVAPTTGLTAFRVVQEGLSNALRHAPGAPVSVWVGPASAPAPGTADGGTSGQASERISGASGLLVSVVNGAATGTDGALSTAGLGRLGAGLGLKGMRERVEGIGGTLTVGPTADGFAVAAVLPYD